MRFRPLLFVTPLLLALSACAAGPPAPSSTRSSTCSSTPSSAPAASRPAAALRGAPYFNARALDLYRLLPPPPEAGSPQERAELDQLLQIQATRTPGQVALARQDARISIYRFADALGNPAGFNPRQLPLTTALFHQLGNDERGALESAKDAFARPRPFTVEHRLSPVIMKPFSPSYPSGHATWSYTAAIILADMVPERRARIFARAAQFAHNRNIAGVHYPSDVAAGQLAGTVIAAALLASPRFIADERAAAQELRQALGLPPLRRH